MDFAPFLLVRRHFPSHRIADIPATVREQLAAAGFAARLKPGSSIAIGVGSRGIANLSTIAGAVVGWFREQGMRPFIFPAMGSHGSATAKGQAAVLAAFGITAEAMGCPVRSRLDVVQLGATPEGIETFMDKTAYSSDGVFLVSRVKWHTDFDGKIESGLFKMMAIGLGKLAGARRYHAHAYKLGLEAVVLGAGRQVLASGKILGGLAILEDAHHDTGRLAAVRVEDMEQKEAELLAQVKTWMPRLPVEALDLLILNEIGKNHSGAGMDTRVVNRGANGEYNPWPGTPRIERIMVRDLSPHSYGNALGIGLADVAHRRVLRRMNRKATYVNGLTASHPAVLRMPILYPQDRQCLEAIWPTVGKHRAADVTIGWARNSQDLTLMAFTENLRHELEGQEGVEILGTARALEFDEQGNLGDWLA